MRIVVCDAGPVLHLSEAGAFGLLEKAGEVFIPTAVDREVVRHLPDWPARRPGWVRVQSPPDPSAGQLIQWAAQIDIGPGEMEAIVLAQSLAADWLLLAKSSLWVSPAIVAEARRALDALQG